MVAVAKGYAKVEFSVVRANCSSRYRRIGTVGRSDGSERVVVRQLAKESLGLPGSENPRSPRVTFCGDFSGAAACDRPPDGN
jgi:hypothetical protein